MRRARALATAAGVVLLHVGAVVWTGANGLVPTRPLYDGAGYSPPPYRWVERPPGLSGSIEPPSSAERVVDLEAGPAGLTVVTDDVQVLVVFFEGTFDAIEGSEVAVEIEPLDPSGLGPPPKDMRFDSNAYRITATSVTGGVPARLLADGCPPDAQPKICPTVMLRYAVRGTDILRWADEEGRWLPLPSNPVFATLQLFADTDELGTFVAAGPDAGFPPEGDEAQVVLSVALATSAAVNGLLIVRGRRRRPRARSEPQLL